MLVLLPVLEGDHFQKVELLPVVVLLGEDVALGIGDLGGMELDAAVLALVQRLLGHELEALALQLPNTLRSLTATSLNHYFLNSIIVHNSATVN